MDVAGWRVRRVSRQEGDEEAEEEEEEGDGDKV